MDNRPRSQDSPVATPTSDDEREAQRLLAELKPELTVDQYRRVVRAVDRGHTAAADSITAEMDAVIESIARHFPAFAPAIRAVAAHVGDDSYPCRDHCASPWPHTGPDADEAQP